MDKTEASIAALKDIDGVDSIILAERIGIVVESFLPKDKDTTEISAMAASLWGIGEYFISKLGSGELNCITIESKKTNIMVFPYKGKILVIGVKKDFATEEFKKKVQNTLIGL